VKFRLITHIGVRSIGVYYEAVNMKNRTDKRNLILSGERGLTFVSSWFYIIIISFIIREQKKKSLIWLELLKISTYMHLDLVK
jgi:hypothetical protein